METRIPRTRSAKLNARVERLENQVLLDAIVPPAELVPYLNEQKNMPPEVKEMFQSWFEAVLTAMRRKLVPLREILDVFPEPFRAKVIVAVRQKLESAGPK